MSELKCKRLCLNQTLYEEEQSKPNSVQFCELTESLSESDIGMTAYMNASVCGFTCTLKSRWEDFVVHEISGDKMAILSSTTPISDSLNSEYDLQSVLDPFRAELNVLGQDGQSLAKIKAPENKLDRSAIHKAIRVFFPKLTSATVNEGRDRYILVTTIKENKLNQRFPKREITGMPSDLPYCHFVLHKRGKDTISAIQTLSRLLRINSNRFAYAGTKDKRAITSQFVTVKGVNSKRLAQLNSCLQGIRLGNFNYISNPLFLGDLSGNRFTVVLRSVTAPSETVKQAISDWMQNGFINYYGLQRFGHSSSSISFDIGKHLIKSEWEQAIDLILKPTSFDLPKVRKMKEDYVLTGDAEQCIRDAPPSLEKTLLVGIAKHGKSLNALQLLPRNLRRLYVHSYQSFIWNHVATLRLESFGPNAEPGDLFLSATDELLDIHSYNDDAQKCFVPVSTSCSQPSRLPILPELVTDRNCKSVRLTDLVLPLPGFAVRLPTNSSSICYSELLKRDGLTMEEFKHRVSDFALPGSYRSLIVKPKDVHFVCRSYIDPNEPLLRSDLELITNDMRQDFSMSLDEMCPEIPDSSLKDDRCHAVILQFCLPKSSYATVAIRQLTKNVVEKR